MSSATTTPTRPRKALPAAALIALAALAGCDSRSPGEPSSSAAGRSGVKAPPPPPIKPPANPSATQEISPFRFTELARDAGIDFEHTSGMTPDRHFPTANGSGLALLDYDGDG